VAGARAYMLPLATLDSETPTGAAYFGEDDRLLPILPSNHQVALHRADKLQMLTHPPTRSEPWRPTPAL
jgi:hypothetical protein